MSVVLSILYHRALRDRKEYILLMGMSLADTLNVAGYALYGIYNLVFRTEDMLSPAQCLLVPYTAIWFFADHNAPLWWLTLALDRFYAVTKPLSYYSATSRYGKRVLMAVNGFSAAMALWATTLVLTTDQTRRIGSQCGAAYLFPPDSESKLERFWVWQGLRLTPSLALLSVLVQAAIWPVHRYQRRKATRRKSDHQREADQKRQNKITKSIAISGICTVVTYFVPYTAGIQIYLMGYRALANLCFLVMLSNSFCNFFIYQWRHREMKQALRALLARKEMPPTLELWGAVKI